MTERLFDFDSHLSIFDCRVTSCKPIEGTDNYSLILDRTAFYPTGGGQKCDEGTIDGAIVSDVYEDGEDIVHVVNKSFIVGTVVNGIIDSALRHRRMQNHTGEHIICGIAHRLYGAENTGFHMGTLGVTADLSVKLNSAEIDKIEDIANLAVSENREVRCYYPNESELASLAYRSKDSVSGRIRIVEVDGYDVCACCAPHVKRTGEIGIIKILSFQSYKGGTRLLMKCGLDAVEDYRTRLGYLDELSRLFCASDGEIITAAEHLIERNKNLAYLLDRANQMRINSRIEGCDDASGLGCMFCEEAPPDTLRESVNLALQKGFDTFASFGSDGDSFGYCIGSKLINLSVYAKDMNKALGGRGGGRPEMIQGRVSAGKDEIIGFIKPDTVL